MTTTQDITAPTPEEHLQNLTEAVLDDYLSGPDHDAEPDPAADARFSQFVLTVADDPIEAFTAYFERGADDAEVNRFLREYGLDATFADLKGFLERRSR